MLTVAVDGSCALPRPQSLCSRGESSKPDQASADAAVSAGSADFGESVLAHSHPGVQSA